MKKHNSKLLYFLVGIVIFASSCQRGYGCPNNVEIDLSWFFTILG